MMNDLNSSQSFYHDQSIQIRKEIRQMDMNFKELLQNSKSSSSQKQQQILKQDMNFLVIGPCKSGKSSLLRTMYFALNSNWNPQITLSELPGTVIKRFDIKRNKKYQIQGLAKMKETDQKRTISGFQFEDKTHTNHNKQLNSEEKSSKVFQKYSNALQLIDNRVFGCFKVSTSNNGHFYSGDNNQTSSPFVSIRTILIVLNVLSKIQFEEISCMKFFLADAREKGIKTLIILTHVDKFNHLKESDKLTLIEERINILRKQLEIKDRDDFICVQNYHELSDSNMSAQKTGQLTKYLSPETRPTNNFQNPNHSHKKICQEPTKNNQGSGFQYKKVSQSYAKDSGFQIQIPNLSKNQKHVGLFEPQKGSHMQQTALTVSRSISCNSTQENRYAKVSAKNIISLSHIPQNLEEKCSVKKASQNNYQPVYQKVHQQNTHSHLQTTNIKNSEEINYYSLKLLMKILKQSQTYVNRELKQRKIIKWFCG